MIAKPRLILGLYGFSYYKEYYDGWNHVLKLGLLCFEWSTPAIDKELIPIEINDWVISDSTNTMRAFWVFQVKFIKDGLLYDVNDTYQKAERCSKIPYKLVKNIIKNVKGKNLVDVHNREGI